MSWLTRLMGLPEGTGEFFTPGGSSATLTALTVARDVKIPDGDLT
ncbi:hypothetical protein [Streptomyces lavendofoliae]